MNFRLTGNHITCKGCKVDIDLGPLKIGELKRCSCKTMRAYRIDDICVRFWENYNIITAKADYQEDFIIRFKPI